MTKPIVLLDLDDTILDFHKAERIAITKALRGVGLEPTDRVIERYSQINDMQWKRLELGELTRDQVLLGRFDILFEEFGADCDSYKAMKSYEDFLSQGHYFMPGAEAMLEELKGKYRLFICSNGTGKVQAGRLASAGIEHYFEEIFISEEIGHNKPSIEFFEGCFSIIKNFERNSCIMLGDRLSSDILGGINAGIKTIWYNPQAMPGKEGIVPDYELRELEQVPGLLKRIFG